LKNPFFSLNNEQDPKNKKATKSNNSQGQPEQPTSEVPAASKKRIP
jgi:hypothetical protein